MFEFRIRLSAWGMRRKQRFIDEVLRSFEFCYTVLLIPHISMIFDGVIDWGVSQAFPDVVRLQSYGVNLNKCVFGQTEVEFLGWWPEKGLDRYWHEAIRDYRMPETVKDLRRYLGMINFYRRFLSKAAEILAPLNDLLCNNACIQYYNRSLTD